MTKTVAKNKPLYENYYSNEKTKNARFDIYGYSPPPDGKYRIDGVEYDVGEDFRTVERYKEYAEAGMNILFVQSTARYNGEEFSESVLKRVMDNAAEAGINKIIVLDDRLMSLSRTDGGIVGDDKRFANEKEIDAYISFCMKPYMDHPSFYGVQLCDEPSYKKFITISEIFASVKRVYPKAFVQCNLLPLGGINVAENAYPDGGDIYDRYERYLSYYADITKSDYIMYDSYPIAEQFCDNNISRMHLKGLQIANRVCQKKGVKLYLVMQSFAMQIDGAYYTKMPNDAQMNWQANVALAFGVKQFAYFTYWAKADNRNDGEYFYDGTAMMTRAGRRTPLYDRVKRINAYMQKLAPVILEFDYVGDRYAVKVPARSRPFHLEYTERGFLNGVSEVNTDLEVALAVELRDRKRGIPMYAVINITDPKFAEICERKQNTTLAFAEDYDTVDIFENGEWRTEKIKGGKYTAKLNPGYGQFIIPYKEDL